MDDDCLRGRRGRFLGKVGQPGLRCLGKDWYGVCHIRADIDVADVQRLQQRQTTRKLMPGDGDVLWRKGFFQRAACFQQGDQRGRLLVTDPQRLLCFDGEGDA